jgi:hypothetical protein
MVAQQTNSRGARNFKLLLIKSSTGIGKQAVRVHARGNYHTSEISNGEGKSKLIAVKVGDPESVCPELPGVQVLCYG